MPSRCSTTLAPMAALISFSASLAMSAPLPGDAAVAQLDRAEALIARQDASGRSAFALLGVLTGPDRATLLDGITEAAELTDAASIGIDRAIEAIDATADPDDATTERRFALAVERRELRLPLARARAATILAALQDDDRTRAALATTAVNALHKVTLGGVAIDTRGAVIAGEALLLLDEPAKALASFNTAIERAARGAGADRPAPMDLAEAMIGKSLAIARTEGDRAARIALSDCRTGPPFVVNGAANPLLALLRADAAVRLDRIGNSRPFGIGGYIEALASAPTEAVYLALRRAVFDRINELWTEDAWTPASAPALAQIERTDRQAQDAPATPTAIRTLERLLDRSGTLGAVELSEARLSLARIIAAKDPRRAMLLLLETAGADDGERLGPTALREAYTIGDAITHDDLADPVTAVFDRTLATMIDAAGPGPKREALWRRRAMLFESVGALDKAIKAYDSVPAGSPAYAGAQRRALALSAGELLRTPGAASANAVLDRLSKMGSMPLDDSTRELLEASRILALTELGRFDEVAAEIESLAPTATGSGALMTRAIDGSLAPITARILDAERRGDAGAQRAGAELLLRIVDSDIAKTLDPTRARRKARGTALLYLSRAKEALPVFQYLIEDRFDFRLNTWRGEAFLASGSPSNAYVLFQSVADTLGSRGQTDDPDFWRSWSRMLEILADQPQEPAPGQPARDDEAIRVQINRLRLIDPALGGEPHKRRIEAVERRVKPAGG